MIDGGDRWEKDPKMPQTGDDNSLIEVKAAGGAAATPSAPAVGGGVRFSYSDPGASSVALAGEFNQWSTTANPMTKDDAGNWTVSLPLKPGRYQYKFVVDGNWKEDPSNPEKAEDGLGGQNSVKIVSP